MINYEFLRDKGVFILRPEDPLEAAVVMPAIAKHFVHAQVRHFDFMREDVALDWINQTGKAQTSPLA